MSTFEAAAKPDPSPAPQWADFCRRLHTLVPKDGRRKVVVDCDAGVDDIDALMMVLNDPDVDVLAVTCVNGNVGRDQVVRNVRRTLAMCNRSDVPVYAGAVGPLVEPPRDAGYFHGVDGIGGVDAAEIETAAGDAAKLLALEKTWPPLVPENAVTALLRLAREHVVPAEGLLGGTLREGDSLQAAAERLEAAAVRQQGKAREAADKGEYQEAHVRSVDHHRLRQRARSMRAAAGLCGGAPCAPTLEILSLAPVTNLALAARMDEAFAGAVKSIFIMAGADKTRGNTPLMPAVEFNAHADPEALAAVVSSFDQAVLVPFDCCLKHSWSWPEVEAWHGIDSERARYAQKISKHTNALWKSLGSDFITADPLAAALLLLPEAVVSMDKIKHRHVAVELNAGSTTHGQTTVDHEGYSSQDATTWIMPTMDHALLTQLMAATYLDTPQGHKEMTRIKSVWLPKTKTAA